MIVYLDGRFLPEAEARLSVFDRGFLYGDGIFETLRAYAGRLFRWPQHWARLAASAAALRLPAPPPAAELAAVFAELLRQNGLADARLRLTLTRGRAGRLDELAGGSGTLLAVAEPLAAPPPECATGVQVEFASFTRGAGSPAVAHKTLGWLPNLLAWSQARAAGAFEALFLNEAGELAEGARSSFFFVRGQEVCTPALAVGILPGITRQVVRELCPAAGLAWREERFRPADLAGAAEAFLGNSVQELVPVARAGEARFGPPCPGPATARLAAAYRRLAREG